MQLSDIANKTYTERYLLRDGEGRLTEDVEGLFLRVASHVASAEGELWKQGRWVTRFYDLMKNGDFLPNTPTLINAGRQNGQLSACFVLPIEDSISGIYKTLGDAAEVHRTGGGTGFSFSSLRPEGAMVSNKTGVSTGPLAFCQVYDKSTDVVKQGATRRGANMMTFDVHHPDILAFIDMKLTPGVMTNFNVSVCVTDEFMEAVKNDTEYELRFEGAVYGHLNARDVWRRIAENAHKSAEPGIIFIDRVNSHSPYEETIVATNPCGEQPLPPYGACNLGSINLARFVENGRLDWNRLRNVIFTSVRFLDNVVTVNAWPLPEIKAHADKYRNIGLGYMGFADALILLGIPYGSKASIDLARELGCFLNQHAHAESYRLGQEKGLPSGAPFKSFFGYSHGDRRNATLTTMAPTGTISMVVQYWEGPVSSSGEPNFAYEFERHQLDQIMVEKHWLKRKADEEGWYDKKLFVESSDVTPDQHVAIQAAFQKHCDSAISKTANLPNDCSVEDVISIYNLAWETGCKGVTVYRDGSRGGVLHKVEVKEDDTVEPESYCCEAPSIVYEGGCEVCKNCAVSKCLIA